MNEKIITILKTFTAEDVKDFKKFIVSPYFSRGRNFEKYFTSLLKFYPGFEIDKNKFLKSYFGKKDDGDGKQSKILRTLNSDFAKVLDDYIAVDSFKRMKFYSNFILNEGYAFRGLYGMAEVKIDDTIASKEDLDPGYIKEMQMLLLKNLSAHFKSQQNKNSEIYDIVESETEDLLSFIFSISSHLKNSLAVNSRSFNISKETEQLSLFFENFDFENFLAKLRPDYPNYKKIKLDIIFLCILLKNNKFENMYIRLNELYMDTFDTLDIRDKMNYFMNVINYYTANQSEKIIPVKFEFVKFGLSKGLFPSGEMKYLNTGAFKMFLLSGLHAGDIDWAEKFIKEYTKKIHMDDRQNMLHYSNAYTAHYRKEYLKSLEFISKFKFENEVFTHDMKLMQLKNYYELAGQAESYIENLNYSIDAFSHFLKDNKRVSVFYRKTGREFISGIRLLSRLRFGSLKRDKQEIKYDLEKLQKETNNLWLMSKIKELL